MSLFEVGQTYYFSKEKAEPRIKRFENKSIDANLANEIDGVIFVAKNEYKNKVGGLEVIANWCEMVVIK